MVRTVLVGMVAAGLMVSACTTKSSDSLDAVAHDYVLLSLTIGEKEPGYIDAYYGPPELQAKAKADAPGQSLEALAKRTDALQRRVAALSGDGEVMDRRRAAFLAAQLTAATTRLMMLQGRKLSFADESRGLFGATPELKPLSHYDPVLARIETLVPGSGTLADRVDAFQNRFNIPPAKLKPVFDAAIAECRRRTVAHIALPAN